MSTILTTRAERLDVAVNQGVCAAIRMLQGAPGVKSDGAVRLRTIEVANRSDVAGLVSTNARSLFERNNFVEFEFQRPAKASQHLEGRIVRARVLIFLIGRHIGKIQFVGHFLLGPFLSEFFRLRTRGVCKALESFRGAEASQSAGFFFDLHTFRHIGLHLWS